MDRMRKAAGRLDTFFHILQIAYIVAAVAAGVGLALIAVCFIFKLNPEMIGTGYNTPDIGFLELTLAEAFVPDKRSILAVVAVDIAMGGILSLLGRAGVSCIRRLLAPMKEGLPFHNSAAACLKRLALLSLVMGAVLNISELASRLLTDHVYGLSELLLSDRVLAVQMRGKLDLSCLVVSGVLLLLSYVFRYGQTLQQLSDETV